MNSPVNFLHSHISHDGPLMAFERFFGDVNDLIGRLGAELFGRVAEHLLVRAVDLNLKQTQSEIE